MCCADVEICGASRGFGYIYINYITKVQLQKSLIFVVVGWVINSETTLEHVIYPNVFLKRIDFFWIGLLTFKWEKNEYGPIW